MRNVFIRIQHSAFRIQNSEFPLMDDCLIIGGGVVGLSLAYALSGEGLRIRVLEAGEPGREASWAGAGILPPATANSRDPLEQLTALSNALHADWAAQLRAETGIDNGFRRCGGIYLARDQAAAAELRQQAAARRQLGLSVVEVPPAEIAARQPELLPDPSPQAAFFLADECQVRNPRHLQALIAGCRRRQVSIECNQAVERFGIAGDRVAEVHSRTNRFAAGSVCLAAGCWSAGLAAQLGIEPAIKPVRGQIALLATDRPLLAHVVNEGRRYLVPRDDGRMLVGSTEEDVGFNRQPTADGIKGLLELAASLVPALGSARFERGWAGLRPASADGLPYLGRLPRYENAFIAAGHFRSGLQLSPGTAVTMGRLICQRDPQLDLSPFAPARVRSF
jgi:glycine oxidase